LTPSAVNTPSTTKSTTVRNLQVVFVALEEGFNFFAAFEMIFNIPQ